MAHAWLDEQYYVNTLKCESKLPFLHQPLSELFFTSQMGIKIIKIIRGEKHINIPEAFNTLQTGDIVYYAGTQNQLDDFRDIMSQGTPDLGSKEIMGSVPMTFRKFARTQKELPTSDQLLCYAVVLEKGMPLINKRIKDTAIKGEWGGLLIGLERGLYPIFNPDVDLKLEINDLVWILGSHKTAVKMAKANVM
jgi:CPA2 family monovalent cation:H+ antiporter-2